MLFLNMSILNISVEVPFYKDPFPSPPILPPHSKYSTFNYYVNNEKNKHKYVKACLSLSGKYHLTICCMFLRNFTFSASAEHPLPSTEPVGGLSIGK